LVGSGIFQFFLSNFRLPLFAVALVVAGMAILFARSWGYFIVYFITFASLMPPQRTSLLPIAGTIHHALWLYAGFEREVTLILLNVLCAGLFAWTHYVLHRAGSLDQPLSAPTRHRVVVAALLTSAAAILLPIVFFIYALIVDPPGPGGPGAPGGGMIALIVVLLSWPFVLAGLIGVILFGLILRRSRRTEIGGKT